jgi:tyrosine-protein phosphatase SIW14
VLAAAVVGHGEIPLPNRENPQASSPHLPNFGTVTANLLRGGQPTAEGFRILAASGVQVVINLRLETFPDVAERRLVESLGMRYVAIPMHGLFTPTHAAVATFLTELCAHRGERVFVHCRRGAERTGVAVAAVRIAFQGWRPADAIAEMVRFGYRRLLFPHYTRFVRRLPAALASEPAFAALHKGPCLEGTARPGSQGNRLTAPVVGPGVVEPTL